MHQRAVIIRSRRHHAGDTSHLLEDLSRQVATIHYTEILADSRDNVQIIACVDQEEPNSSNPDN